MCSSSYPNIGTQLTDPGIQVSTGRPQGTLGHIKLGLPLPLKTCYAGIGSVVGL